MLNYPFKTIHLYQATLLNLVNPPKNNVLKPSFAYSGITSNHKVRKK